MYAGVAKTGAIAAGINPRLAPSEQEAALDVLQPSTVLTGIDEARAPGAPVPVLEPDPARDAVIVLTSGTTGTPKGAVFTEGHLAAIAEMDASAGYGQGGPMLASTEFAHIGFMTKLPQHLRAGARIHMLGRWRAREALEVIARERIPSVGGISAQIALMLRDLSFDRHDLSCVRAIVAGGGPSAPALVREARARFGAPYSIRYSSTESGGVGTATAMDADDEETLHTVGRPRGGTELRIDEPDARGVGEVWLRSPAVMKGYWRDPGATTEVLRDGWLRMGDLGWIDRAGCLRLAGRSKEMYIRGGYNVFPAMVESVLGTHPRVREVAVVPRADAVMGEIGVAYVVPAGEAATLDELRAHARDRLAAHELPEAIRIVDEIPLTSMHKIDRRRLAAEEERHASDRAPL
jgi:acyl-CoA synthetase (AMP-forming)/AMP-acid ligase II